MRRGMASVSFGETKPLDCEQDSRGWPCMINASASACVARQIRLLLL